MFEGIATGVFELIGKYTILWNTFERCIYNRKCTQDGICKTRYIISDKTRRLTNDLLNYIGRDIIIECLFPNEYERGQLYRRMTDWQKTNKPINEIVISGILYRIRCNTFHGTKTAYTIQAQRRMFETINDLLAEIIVSNGNEQLLY